MKVTITNELDGRELMEEIEEYGYDGDDRMEISKYARWFDESCYGWTSNHDMNMFYLMEVQRYLNDLLKLRGYVFLNEVYRRLGMKELCDGQFIGWIYDEKNPVGDNYIDFGIHDSRNLGFIKGEELDVLLDFNVDGNISEYLRRNKKIEL